MWVKTVKYLYHKLGFYEIGFSYWVVTPKLMVWETYIITKLNCLRFKNVSIDKNRKVFHSSKQVNL